MPETSSDGHLTLSELIRNRDACRAMAVTAMDNAFNCHLWPEQYTGPVQKHLHDATSWTESTSIWERQIEVMREQEAQCN